MGAQTYTTSSGFVLPGRRILTNAHSVEHHTMVRVKRRACDIRFVGTVIASSDECDLALLTVSDPDFWNLTVPSSTSTTSSTTTTDDEADSDSSSSPNKQQQQQQQQPLVPLQLGKLPKLRDSVIVAGYPHGGDGVSVTAGVVSRVELLDYSSSSTLLSVQIDAAINPGNSGGPALDDEGRVVGVAFRVMVADVSENIGYLIPPPVVQHFLDDVAAHGRYTGFCSTGFDWVDLEARAARRARGLPTGESGVLVRSVPPCSPARGVLKVGDVVTHVDENDVSNAGTVFHEESGERMYFHVLVSQKFIGDTLRLRVFRNGRKRRLQEKETEIGGGGGADGAETDNEPNNGGRSFEAGTEEEEEGKFVNVSFALPELNSLSLIPVHTSPSVQTQYFVYGGCVFVALTGAYLRSGYGTGPVANSRTPVQIRWIWEYGVKHHAEEQVVVLSHVLNAELNIHYEHLFDERVHRVNGVRIQNLRHLVETVQKTMDQFVRFELLEETVVLEREEAQSENQKILDMHHIPKACSFDDVEEKKDRE